MIPQRWLPLVMLIDARFREFFREPEVIFWVYGFPLGLAIGLFFAFSNAKPETPDVDVAYEDAWIQSAEKLAGRLRDPRWKDEAIKVEVHPEEECKKRLTMGKTALYIVQMPDRIKYVYDPARADSVQARYWAEALLERNQHGDLVEAATLSEPGSRYIDFLLPGLIGLNIMGGGMFGVGFVLVDMRVRKLFKRLRATPMRNSDFLLSLLIARLLFLLPEMTVLLCVGHYGLSVPINGDLVSLCIVILIGATAFAGVGLLVGSRTDKTETASGLMNLIMLPMWIFSGVFFSAKRFPDAMQPFVQALPLTQLIESLRAVILEGKGLFDENVWWRLTILLAYSVIAFAVALYIFKWR